MVPKIWIWDVFLHLRTERYWVQNTSRTQYLKKVICSSYLQEIQFFDSFPLFPFVMIGAVIIQVRGVCAARHQTLMTKRSNIIRLDSIESHLVA